MKHQKVIDALKWRYATKVFDKEAKIKASDLRTILESARLAPSSFGTEPWKFIVVENPDVRAQLRTAAYDQSKVTDASHIIVLARRTDAEKITPELIARTAATQGKSEADLVALKEMVEGAVAYKQGAGVYDGWAAGQTYLALGVMIETASLLEIDNCPMEGFDRAKVDEILGLKEKHLASVTMLALGKRGVDTYATLPKTRRNFDEVVEFVK
jgi:nitroreductase